MAANRVAVLSGSTGTIGQAIASALSASNIPTTVVLCVRDMNRGQQLAEQLKQSSRHTSIHCQQCDLSSVQSMVDACQQINNKYGQVNVLMNGAATVPVQRTETVDGIETQFAVNILSYYLLADQLLPSLKRAVGDKYGARIVNMSSKFASDWDIEDMQFNKRPYVNKDAHHASKAAVRLLTHAQADLYNGIGVFAVHPGIVMSELLKSVGVNKGYNTPEQGARTAVFACNSETLVGQTDIYLENSRPVKCQWADSTDASKLISYLQALKQKHL